MRDYRQVRKGIEFDNPADSGMVLEGYMTGDEFRKAVKEDMDTFCREHGLLGTARTNIPE
ncbi:MAG: hypothetical protein LBR86_08355 [Tannerella sp.]|jgi:hypothetical protein|nr:hypothetical protein [Tannerella sp.]